MPVQQLSDAGEDLVRLAAAKDAEIAALTDAVEYHSRDAARLLTECNSLTEQRDILTERLAELVAVSQKLEGYLKVVEAARAYRDAETDGTPRMYRGKALQDLANALDDTLAALDAEAAAETEGT